MIRRATSDDLDAMIEMGARMHAVGHYAKLPYDGAKLKALALRLLDSPDGFLLVAEKHGRPIGMMVAYAEEYYFCREKQAQDLLLWVNEEARGGPDATEMVTAFADWAKSRGIKDVQLCDTNGADQDKLRNFYQSLGYRQAGSIYKRTL